MPGLTWIKESRHILGLSPFCSENIGLSRDNELFFECKAPQHFLSKLLVQHPALRGSAMPYFQKELRFNTLLTTHDPSQVINSSQFGTSGWFLFCSDEQQETKVFKSTRQQRARYTCQSTHTMVYIYPVWIWCGFKLGAFWDWIQILPSPVWIQTRLGTFFWDWIQTPLPCFESKPDSNWVYTFFWDWIQIPPLFESRPHPG